MKNALDKINIRSFFNMLRNVFCHRAFLILYAVIIISEISMLMTGTLSLHYGNKKSFTLET